MTRKEAIEEISNVLRSLTTCQTWLYGSSARGDYKENSDIDLLILLSDPMSVSERIDIEKEIAGRLLPIEINSGLSINPVILPKHVWNQRKTPFTVNVVNERIPL